VSKLQIYVKYYRNKKKKTGSQGRKQLQSVHWIMQMRFLLRQTVKRPYASIGHDLQDNPATKQIQKSQANRLYKYKYIYIYMYVYKWSQRFSFVKGWTYLCDNFVYILFWRARSLFLCQISRGKHVGGYYLIINLKQIKEKFVRNRDYNCPHAPYTQLSIFIRWSLGHIRLSNRNVCYLAGGTLWYHSRRFQEQQ